MARFIVLHQSGKPVAINEDSIKLVYTAIKGRGSLVVTDQDGHDLSVDESFDDITGLLSELEVDFLECAND